jgi:MinD-like ATPase involved in chromosome partitioning or flagellar assembly
VVSPKGGPGKSTITAILGDALARNLPNHRVLAVDCNPGGGTRGVMAPEARAARFSLLDLYEHRETVQTRAHLQPYVAALPSGLDVLAVPPDPHLALKIKPEHYSTLLEECLLPNYELVLLDTSPDITSPVTQLALREADQLVLVAEQGYLTAEVIWHALDFLLASPAAGPDGSCATIAINKVVAEPKAGRVDELQRQLRKVHEGPQVQIPFDLDLHAAIAAGHYSLPEVKRRTTRLPLKQLPLDVTERFP